MKKLLIVLVICVLPALIGCRKSSSGLPVFPPGVDANDPWQRYPDGTPGVIDLRL